MRMYTKLNLIVAIVALLGLAAAGAALAQSVATPACKSPGGSLALPYESAVPSGDDYDRF